MKIMTDSVIPPIDEIDPIVHMHKAWFEIEKIEYGTIIMCPEGCRRLLAKDGYVAEYDKEKDEWVRI